MEDDAVFPGLSGARGYMSYSRDDHEDVRRLSQHLIPAARAELGVDFWTDAAITPGSQWFEIVSDALAESKIFILCVSPHYLASEFRYRVEFPAIQTRAQSSDALVIPVILRPCSWWGFVGDYQAVPSKNGRIVPISDWRPRDAGYHAAATQIIQGIAYRFKPAAEKRELQPLNAKDAAPRPVPPAPHGHHKIAPRDIDRAVKTVIARHTAKTGA